MPPRGDTPSTRGELSGDGAGLAEALAFLLCRRCPGDDGSELVFSANPKKPRKEDFFGRAF